jgi:hypothetical protein
MDPIDARIAELTTRRVVVEVPLGSRIPVLRPLVIAVRSVMNRISTIWYVRPLTQQQNAINHLVVDTLTDLAKIQRRIATDLAKSNLAAGAILESSVELERFTSQINRDLAKLEVRVRELEQWRLTSPGNVGAENDSGSSSP